MSEQTSPDLTPADLSLAVPHGFRLAPGTALPGLAARLREALLPVRRRIEVAQVAAFAAQLLDQADLSGSDRPGSVIFDAVQAQADHVHKVLAGEHECPLNVVSVAVSDDPATGELYALFFHQHEEFADALDELEVGEYFPYWPEDEAGERRPTGVSARQWAERAGVWTRVLRGEDPQRPGNMFKIDLGSPLPDMDLITQAEEVLAAMPTREQRILHALNVFAQSQAEDIHSPTEVMDLMAQMPAHQARIEQALKPITLADLAGAGASGAVSAVPVSALSVPMPAPPAARFVPALVAVNERRGVTVVIDRQPNLCRWAVHAETAAGPATVSGPAQGEPTNPSNRELAAQITQAVSRLADRRGIGVGQVFTADWASAELLRAKTSLPVTDLAAPAPALAAAREAIAAVERKLVTGLTLACDSSRGRGRTVNGCGYVLAYANGADPIVGAYTTTSTHGGIRAGELAAIRKGLQATLNHHPVLREGVGSLKVLTDSRAALDLLERVAADGATPADDTDSVQECRRILGSARGVNIRFEWVRGHDGHALNTLADRLAVLARRNRELAIDEVTNARMVAAVRQDARELLRAA